MKKAIKATLEKTAVGRSALNRYLVFRTSQAAKQSTVDLQAQLEQTPGEQKAGVQWLINRLETYRQQKRQDLDAFLQALDEDSLKQQIRSCIPEGATFNGQS